MEASTEVLMIQEGAALRSDVAKVTQRCDLMAARLDRLESVNSKALSPRFQEGDLFGNAQGNCLEQHVKDLQAEREVQKELNLQMQKSLTALQAELRALARSMPSFSENVVDAPPGCGAPLMLKGPCYQSSLAISTPDDKGGGGPDHIQSIPDEHSYGDLSMEALESLVPDETINRSIDMHLSREFPSSHAYSSYSPVAYSEPVPSSCDHAYSGTFRITHDEGLFVRRTASLDSELITTLAYDTKVEVIETVMRLSRVRARIATPDGWISLANVKDGTRWAEQACMATSMSTRTVSRALDISTGEVKRSVTDVDYLGVGHLDEKLPSLPHNCQVFSNDFGAVSKRPSPDNINYHGIYRIVHDEGIVVRGTAALDSSWIATLPFDSIVTVLEAMTVKEIGRVRARIEKPEGWVSLANVENDTWWAEKVAMLCSGREVADGMMCRSKNEQGLSEAAWHLQSLIRSTTGRLKPRSVSRV